MNKTIIVSNRLFFPMTLSFTIFSHLKTVLLAALESGAPLSSFIERALYKCSI